MLQRLRKDNEYVKEVLIMLEIKVFQREFDLMK